MAASAADPSTAHLALPFFDDAHRALARGLLPWAAAQDVDERDDRAACRDWVRRLGDGGWLRYCVPAASGGALERLDSRALVLLRETLAFHSPLADFAFAMQGLGSGAITLAGSAAQQAALPAAGRAAASKIAAFALSEPEAGSDVGAMAMRADATADGWRLDGEKTWISNGGIADFYCVFAKTDPTGGTRGITAFIVDATTPGPRHLGPHRRDGAASAGDAALRRLRRCRATRNWASSTAASSWRCARSTSSAPRSPPPRSAWRAAHWPKPSQHAQQPPDVRPDAGRLPAHAGQARRDGRADRQRRPADLPRRLDARRQRAHAAQPPSATSPPPPRWPRCRATENAQRVIDMALQMHGGLRRARSAPRSRACTATSARCASTKARPRCSN